MRLHLKTESTGRRWLLLLSALTLTLAGFLFFFPLSSVLLKFSSDGSLVSSTRDFVDTAWLTLAGLGVSLFLIARVSTWNLAFRAACSAPASGGPASAVPILGVAVVAFAVRVVLGQWGDSGLGDDGARDMWLRKWLESPHFIDSGLWAPGHLYLQAVFWLVVRDTTQAGMMLSAAAGAGMVILLSRAAGSILGGRAAILCALLVGFQPVAVAYGGISDVNSTFAFLVITTIMSIQRANLPDKSSHALHGVKWWGIAWLSFAFASWSRFEAFLLVPGLAVLCLPNIRRAAGVVILFLLPAFIWNFFAYLQSGDPLHVLHVVQVASTGVVSHAADLFGYWNAMWVCITLPVLLFGTLGVCRAARMRRGRQWLPVLALHMGALLASTWTSANGYQPRYMILDAALLAFYAALALDGIFQVSRRLGTGLVLGALLLVCLLPALHPDRNLTWMRRNPVLREVVACMEKDLPDRHLVWITNESPYFYPDVTQISLSKYHPLSRIDADPEEILEALVGQDRVLLCVREGEESRRILQGFLEAGSANWSLGALRKQCYSYKMYDLVRP